MEDINNWEAKYVNCKYADRLLSKLSELNQQVIPIPEFNLANNSCNK
ncbi:MAG: hypothetical protein QMO91_04370 [Candidatus Tisiphia sp.]|nr:hypothetical protein [Candidatus Tisiphia sp.]